MARPVAPAHPAVFAALLLPFGAAGGYVGVAMGYVLVKAGLPVAEIAALIGIDYLPSALKFLWAPIIDTRLTRKRWYLLGGIGVALGIAALGLIPHPEHAMPLVYLAVIVISLSKTLVGMTTGALMAYDTPLDQKGRASAWSQAGNLGGGGLGGGAGLWFAQHLPDPALAGVVVGALTLLCCAALWLVREPPPLPRGRHLGLDLVHVARDVWGIVTARSSALGMLICILPLSTGSASNLFVAIAGDWHASADTVALVNGFASAVLTAVGCFIGGWATDRIHRQRAYALFGVMLVAVTVGMALTGRTELLYVAWVCSYNLVVGFCYSGWSAVTLEAIGTGAAATKYEIFASLSNIPIGLMTVLDGALQSRWGTPAMLLGDAALGLVAVGIYFGVAARVNRRPQSEYPVTT
jgi:MFS family permease